MGVSVSEEILRKAFFSAFSYYRMYSGKTFAITGNKSMTTFSDLGTPNYHSPLRKIWQKKSGHDVMFDALANNITKSLQEGPVQTIRISLPITPTGQVCQKGSQNASSWKKERQIGNVKLILEESSPEEQPLLYKTQEDIKYARFKLTERKHPLETIAINGTPIVFPYVALNKPAGNFLNSHLPSLIKLLDCYRHVQEKHNRPFADVLCYGTHNTYDLNGLFNSPALGKNVIFFDDRYLRMVEQKPEYTEILFNHALGHHFYKHLTPASSSQQEAFTRLRDLAAPIEFLSHIESDPVRLTIRLLTSFEKIDKIKEFFERIDQTLQSVGTECIAAAEHMKNFPEFEMVSPEYIAVDMARNNRFIEHALKIPALKDDTVRSIRNMSDVTRRTPNFYHAKSDHVAEITEMLEALLNKHADLFEACMTLETCSNAISHGNILRADLIAVEMAENPDSVAEAYGMHIEDMDQEFLRQASLYSNQRCERILDEDKFNRLMDHPPEEKLPSQTTNALVLSLSHRFEAARDYADFVNQERKKAQGIANGR